MSKSMDMVKTAYQALDKKLAEDIRVIDISEVSVLADYFIIANGANINQVQAIADEVLEKMGQAGYQLRQIEGYQSAIWILMDFSFPGTTEGSMIWNESGGTEKSWK